MHPRTVRRIDDIGTDHQVDEQEVGGQRRVGMNAAYARGAKNDGVEALLVHPALDIDLPGKVHVLTAGHDNLTGLRLQAAHDRGAHHATMASNPDALCRYVERSRGHGGLEFGFFAHFKGGET